MYSYAFASYLDENNMSKIFNQNLTHLQTSVDKLSVILVTDTQSLYDQKETSKGKIIDVVDYCESISKQLLRLVQEDRQNNKWIFRNM